jgi:DNA-binding transcriptional regulator YdaS (Cro superfamily)
MTYNQAISYFGTQTRLAAALGISQSTVSCWRRVIPASKQYQLEIITNRALKADAELRKPRTVGIYEFQ